MKKLKYSANNRSFFLGIRLYTYELIINDLKNIEKLTILNSFVDSKNSIDRKIMLEILRFEGERYSCPTIYPNSSYYTIDLITSGIDLMTDYKEEFFPTVIISDGWDE